MERQCRLMVTRGQRLLVRVMVRPYGSDAFCVESEFDVTAQLPAVYAAAQCAPEPEKSAWLPDDLPGDS